MLMMMEYRATREGMKLGNVIAWGGTSYWIALGT